MWDSPQGVAWFQRLAGLGRVVMLDRRGIGLSDQFMPGEAPPVRYWSRTLGPSWMRPA